MLAPVQGGKQARRTTHALIYAAILGPLAVWLLVPRLGLTVIVRAWLGALWSAFRSTFLRGTATSSPNSWLPTLTVLSASLVTVLPRLAVLTWPSFSFVRKRQRAARIRARAAAA